MDIAKLRKLNPDFSEFQTSNQDYWAAMKRISSMPVDEKVRNQIIRMIGKHEYHAEDHQDRHDNLILVLNACPPGWAAAFQDGEALPEDAIVVGHTSGWGNRGYALIYIHPVRAEGAAQ